MIILFSYSPTEVNPANCPDKSSVNIDTLCTQSQSGKATQEINNDKTYPIREINIPS